MRRHQVSALLTLAGLVIGVTGALAAPPAGGPVAVSPGSASKLALIGDTCPAFSWAGGEGAQSYELVVYRVGEESEEAEPVLRQDLPAPAYSWTPSLDRCLEWGGQYAWSVRAVGGKAATEWSAPSLFEVLSGPSEADFEAALQVVQEYLGEETTGSAGMSVGLEESSGAASSTPVAGSPEGASAGPAPQVVAMGDSALQVNGSPVVTVATLAGALCSTTEVRFLDLGDGTALDCNTGKMWLKDASCLGNGTWGSVFSQGTVQRAVGLLNTGLSIFDCRDYTDGTYTDWQVPAMTDLCGLWNGSCTGTACCTASAGLVDTSVGTLPTVGNAAGDGQWAAEDAFVGVKSVSYWSATEGGASFQAWYVSLGNGYVSTLDKDILLYVWPVRGGQ